MTGSPVHQALLMVAPPSGGGGGGGSDPYFSSVVFLASFNGTNGATAFSDESGKAHGAGTFGGSAALSNLHSTLGYSSALLLNQSGHTLDYVQWADSDDWWFGTSPFTVECWFYVTSFNDAFIVTQFNGSTPYAWGLFSSSSSALQFITSTSTSNFNFDVSSGNLTGNTWHAGAYDWDGTKQRLYVDGVMVASLATSRNEYNSSQPLTVGNGASGSQYPFKGFIQEMRITKGVARYASDSGYTVATTPFPRH